MTDCAHPSQEIRAKRARSGATMYGRQCLTCGALASLWLKKETIQDPANVPEWDDTLTDRYHDATRQTFHDLRAIRRAEESAWRERYREVLSSPEWGEKRTAVFQREHGICQGCGDACRHGWEVHHVSALGAYRMLGRELLFQLVLLCPRCHALAHDAEPAELRAAS